MYLDNEKVSHDKLLNALQKHAPLLAGAIQMIFGTMFAFFFMAALVISTLIGIWQIHSLSNRVDELQARIEEQQRTIDNQGQALEAVAKVVQEDMRLERETKQNKALGDALDGFLDRAMKIGEALQKQERMEQQKQ